MRNNLCILPWTGLHTKTNGDIVPCCDFKGGNFHFKGNPNDYRDSKELKNIQQSFINGEWPEGCWSCKKREKSSGVSMRMQETNSYLQRNKLNELTLEHLNDIDKFSYLKLVTSNKCNLGCVMCHETSSSVLYNEKETNSQHFLNMVDGRKFIRHQMISDKNIKKDVKIINPFDGNINENYVSDILDNINTEFTMIAIQGGEPTIIKELHFLIAEIKRRNLQENVYLDVTSNFQQYNKKWFDNLEGFKGRFIASIDAIGEQGEYIRYPSSWKTVEKNLLKFIKEYNHQFDIIVMPTIQILNVLYLDKLVKWCYEHNVKIDLSNQLTSPTNLAVYNLPDNLKEIAIEKINNVADLGICEDQKNSLISYISIPQELEFDCTIAYCERIDEVRNLDWKKTFWLLQNG